MNRLHIAVIIFGSALLLFLFQNCQKSQLQIPQDNASNGALNLPVLEFKYKNVKLIGNADTSSCVGRCLSSGQVILDLENSKIFFNGLWINSDYTDIELNLSANDMQNLRARINRVTKLSRTIPDCDTCSDSIGLPYVLHKYTDYNDFEQNVYLYDLVDSSIFNTTIQVYESPESMDEVICEIKTKLQSTNLDEKQKSELNVILELVTAKDTSALYCI